MKQKIVRMEIEVVHGIVGEIDFGKEQTILRLAQRAGKPQCHHAGIEIWNFGLEGWRWEVIGVGDNITKACGKLTCAAQVGMKQTAVAKTRYLSLFESFW